MADPGDKQSATWPMPKFYFSVNLGDPGQIPFQEVTGLDTESEPILYRAGDSKAFNVIKMPGLIKSGNVTLKKGIFINDNRFWDWFANIKQNLIKPMFTGKKQIADEIKLPTMRFRSNALALVVLTIIVAVVAVTIGFR